MRGLSDSALGQPDPTDVFYGRSLVKRKLFIDGDSGTTGLQLANQLRGLDALHLLEINPAERKDPAAKRALLEEAELVVLCLPDDAARETVSLIDAIPADAPGILDASSAHRVAPGWVYGLPELQPGQAEKIAGARRVSNPGCYPTGFLLLVRPLMDAGWLTPDDRLLVQGLSGYTGGGRSMIEKHEQSPGTWPCRPYGLNLCHKHLPEMQKYAGLGQAPLFTPQVADFPQGMLVQVPLFRDQLIGRPGADQLTELWQNRYLKEPNIQVFPANPLDALDAGFLEPQSCNGSNRVDLFCFGNADQLLLIARLDNLGKGACLAAVQNLRLMLDLPPASDEAA